MSPDHDPAIELRRLINGYQVTQAIHVIVELGIPDLLGDGQMSATDLAHAVNADEDALYRTLRALASIGVLHESPDQQFALAPMGELLRRDNRRSLAPWAAFIGTAAHWQAWSNLSRSISTGESAFRFTHGMDVWEYRREHPAEGNLFDASMTAQTRTADTAVVDAYDFNRFPVVADIGGGRGALLAAILVANPSIRGILFDQPHVLTAAPQLLDEAGVASRCDIVPGSFFETLPSGADAYLLKWIIHDWQDAEALKILHNCREAMPADGRVLLVERLVQGPNDGPEAKWIDMQMLVMAGGRERTREQFEELLGRAGLRLVSVTPTSGTLVVLAGSTRLERQLRATRGGRLARETVDRPGEGIRAAGFDHTVVG